ncbi:MAG: YggS family pyridoxal phosphate-dependent enzyme [Dehalococcoidia bacterium]|nr:YggS family pyridoxal phosphate-dependent enzyme [Dehalococcoidia bacterium]
MSTEKSISENVRAVLSELPHGVELVAAAKTRTAEEISQAINAGINIIGENYIQEADAARNSVKYAARWHFIGSLQKNKVRKAVRLFDMIETVDSVALAQEIDKESAAIAKIMQVLIEINSGREMQKGGVLPEDAAKLIRDISTLRHIRVDGLMTMGPQNCIGDALRPYFATTRNLFNEIKQQSIAGVEMRHLSMGMSDSYKIAIEEGANIVRLGSRLFGPRL